MTEKEVREGERAEGESHDLFCQRSADNGWLQRAQDTVNGHEFVRPCQPPLLLHFLAPRANTGLNTAPAWHNLTIAIAFTQKQGLEKACT